MKRLIVAILLLCLATSLWGCTNKGQMVKGDADDNITAIIELPDGTIVRGNVDEYTRYTHSYIMIEIDGVTYVVHPNDCAFIQGG